jgi:hypothetical protein
MIIEMSRPPGFLAQLTDGDETCSLAFSLLFNPRKISGTHFKETRLWE